MGLFTERGDAVSQAKELDAKLLQARFDLLEQQYQQLLAENKILKEEMAILVKRVDALEDRNMDRVDRMLR